MTDLFNTGIRPAVDEYLKKKDAEVRDYGEYWSASSAGYCMRKNIIKRLGVPEIEKDDDLRKTRVFESGHIFHQWIQEITQNAGLSVAQEIELQDEKLMVRGHIDDLILITGKDAENVTYNEGMVDEKTVTQLKKHLILYDYKTAHSRSFHWAKKNGNQLSHYHKMQLGTYMYMLRKGKYPELSEARILKISKDDLCFLEQQLLWTPVLEKEIYEYWSTLNGYWKSKKMPECTCHVYENGFLAKEAYNGYFYNGQPCSLEYVKKWQAEQKEQNNENI